MFHKLRRPKLFVGWLTWQSSVLFLRIGGEILWRNGDKIHFYHYIIDFLLKQLVFLPSYMKAFLVKGSSNHKLTKTMLFKQKTCVVTNPHGLSQNDRVLAKMHYFFTLTYLTLAEKYIKSIKLYTYQINIQKHLFTSIPLIYSLKSNSSM